MTFVLFVVLVGVLIFVHELGHFVCAKLFGVKVLKFSLGFGPTIAGIKRGDTEYVIAAFPLGGYVRMLGESPDDERKKADEGRAFPDQALWKRMIIVLAGPAMNLLFPMLLYFVVFLGDAQQTPAIVGTVFPGRPADGHLEAGDRILAIDGHDVRTFYELGLYIEPAAGRELEFRVQRGEEEVTTHITPQLTNESLPLDLSEDVGRVGITPFAPLAVVGVVSPSSPAAAAHLRTFDRIVAAGGRPVETFRDLAAVIEPNRGSMIPITYLRPTRVEGPLHGLLDIDRYEPHVATLTPEPGPGSGLSRAGLESSDLYVARVRAGSPEHRAGILPGDRVMSLDGQPVRVWAQLMEDLRRGGGREREITLRRGDQILTRHIAIERDPASIEYGEAASVFTPALDHWAPATVAEPVSNPAIVRYALRQAWRRTGEMVELTFVSIVRLVEGRLTSRTIGGPIAIAEFARSAAEQGPLDFLQLMAFISVNLGLLNLLPIPVLDGGHLFFLVLEGVSRRPVPMKLKQAASLLGLFLILMLAIVAFRNDIERGWPDWVASFEDQ
jgi:regulator of sigma E protease